MFDKKKAYYSILKKTDIERSLLNKTDTECAKKVLSSMLKYFDIEMPKILISKNGKPYFEDSKIFFNYSHSKSYIACVIAICEVGIDIEDTNRKISSLVSKKYLDDEKDDLKKIEIWVKKESFSKFKGLGLLIGLENIILSEVCENNFLIKNEDYICSIYSDLNVIFEELNISRFIN